MLSIQKPVPLCFWGEKCPCWTSCLHLDVDLRFVKCSLRLPPSCLNVGSVFSCLTASPWLLQTSFPLLWPNNSILVLFDHKPLSSEGTLFAHELQLSTHIFGLSWLVLFSVHGEVKLASLWMVMLVLQQLPVHGRLQL